MGYTSLGNVALSLEQTFHSLKESLDPVSDDILLSVEIVVHAIRDSLVDLKEGKAEKNMAQVLEQFKKSLGIGG
jgi:hypothetical protein